MKVVKTSAPGNIFFFGEHFVVYNLPAILSAISRRTYVEASSPQDDGKSILIDSENYGRVYGLLKEHELNYIHVDPELKYTAQLLEYCHDRFGLEEGIYMKIRSDIPKTSGGMSSSTAFLSSLFHALNSYYEWRVKPEEYLVHLYPFQKAIHGGAASGAEFASSIFGGNNLVIKKKDISENEIPINMEPIGDVEFNVVIGNTGIEAKTKTTVSQVKSLYERARERYEELFDNYRAVFEDARKAIIKGETSYLGELMNHNQLLLERLDGVNREINRDTGMYDQLVDIASKELKAFISAALEAGAYGAKLSGGGGGGIMIALVSRENKDQVMKGIMKKASSIGLKNAEVYDVTVGVEGLKLH